jgi:hypothetical protein
MVEQGKLPKGKTSCDLPKPAWLKKILSGNDSPHKAQAETNLRELQEGTYALAVHLTTVPGHERTSESEFSRAGVEKIVERLFYQLSQNDPDTTITTRK